MTACMSIIDIINFQSKNYTNWKNKIWKTLWKRIKREARNASKGRRTKREIDNDTSHEPIDNHMLHVYELLRSSARAILRYVSLRVSNEYTWLVILLNCEKCSVAPESEGDGGRTRRVPAAIKGLNWILTPNIVSQKCIVSVYTSVPWRVCCLVRPPRYWHAHGSCH